MSITNRKPPSANRLTVALLALVMIGFGLFAEHHAQAIPDNTLHAQTTLSGH